MGGDEPGVAVAGGGAIVGGRDSVNDAGEKGGFRGDAEGGERGVNGREEGRELGSTEKDYGFRGRRGDG